MPLILFLALLGRARAAELAVTTAVSPADLERVSALTVGGRSAPLREATCLPQVLESMRTLGATVLSVDVVLVGGIEAEFDTARFDLRYRRADLPGAPGMVTSVSCALARPFRPSN